MSIDNLFVDNLKEIGTFADSMKESIGYRTQNPSFEVEIAI